jgi:hypothetical protein
MDREFYIVSTKHTPISKRGRDGRYVTFFRTDDKGYCWPLSWAGKYPEKTVTGDLGYYNSGCATIAVPVGVVDLLAESPLPGDIDGNAGPVVRNTKRNWRLMLAAAIEPPPHEVKQAV